MQKSGTWYESVAAIQEIEPGQPVRPQLATAVQSPKDAFAKLKGRAYIVETKFDGETMQDKFPVL